MILMTLMILPRTSSSMLTNVVSLKVSHRSAQQALLMGSQELSTVMIKIISPTLRSVTKKMKNAKMLAVEATEILLSYDLYVRMQPIQLKSQHRMMTMSLSGLRMQEMRLMLSIEIICSTHTNFDK